MLLVVSKTRIWGFRPPVPPMRCGSPPLKLPYEWISSVLAWIAFGSYSTGGYERIYGISD